MVLDMIKWKRSKYVKANSNKNKGTSDTEFHWEHIKTNFLLKCSLEPKLTQ